MTAPDRWALLAAGWSSEVYATERSDRVLKLARTQVPGFDDGQSRAALLRAWSRETTALRAIGDVAGVVTLLSSGRYQGRPWLLLTRAHGVTVSQWLRERPLPVAEVSVVLRQLAIALTAVHETGWLHLDLNPGNVILDDVGSPTLLDFGAVQRRGAADPWTWPLGRHRYMAHEHLHGRLESPRYGRLSPASDVHQLACLAMFMLTGGEPFRGCAQDEEYSDGYLAALTLWAALPAENRVGEVIRDARQLPSGVADALVEALNPCPHSRTSTPLRFAEQFRRAVEGGH